MLALNIFSIFSLFALPVPRRGWFGLRDNSHGAGGRRPGSSNAPQDHLGSIRLLTDEAGGVTERTTWGPWGARLEGGRESRFGYTGHQTERESGLRYSVHRYLDPRNGRWTRRDPAGDVDGGNLFRYVRNRPIVAADSTGLRLQIVGGGQAIENLRSAVQKVIGAELLVSEKDGGGIIVKLGNVEQRYTQGLFDARRWIQEIISSPKKLTLRYGSGPYEVDNCTLKGGGFFSGSEVVLHPTSWASYTVKDTAVDRRLAGGLDRVSHTLETVIIHEMFGHALRWIRNLDYGDFSNPMHDVIVPATTHLNYNVGRPQEATPN